MKKILAIGILAMCAFALSQQQASAWCNSRFGIGLNWEHQSGGNSVLWGALRNGQPPGPEVYGGSGFGYAPQYGMPQSGPAPYAYDPPPFQPYAQQPMPAQPYYGQPFQFANRPGYYYSDR